MPVDRNIENAQKAAEIGAAVAGERERCANAVMQALREIGAAPGSSIDSALALVLRKIHYPA